MDVHFFSGFLFLYVHILELCIAYLTVNTKEADVL